MKDNKPVRLKNAISAYLNNLKLKRVKSTLSIKTYQQRLSDFVKFIGSNKEVSKIYLRDIEAFMAVLQDAGLDDSTIAFKLIAIRGLLKWLARQKILCLDYSVIELPKILPKTKEIPTDEQIQQLLKLCDPRSKVGLRNRTILEVLISSGLRVSELCSLKVDKLDLVNNRTTLTGKGGKERLVKFSPTASEYIKKYLKLRRKQSVQDLAQNLLFPMTSRTVERVCHELGQKIGIRLYPHVLRSWYATHLLSCGVDLYSVSRLMGHSNINTTSIYLNYSDLKLEEAHKEAFNPSLTYTSKVV